MSVLKVPALPGRLFVAYTLIVTSGA
jgi:hypothetical protein